MKQVKEIIPDTGLSSTSLNLLRCLWSKELTMDEFLQECAYWALREGFDGLRPRQLPRAPEKAIELENMSLRQRLKIDYTRLYREFPQVQDYYEQKFLIKNHNKAILEWLIEIKLYIPQEDELSHKKLDERIFEFQAVEDDMSLQAERLKETFDGQEI